MIPERWRKIQELFQAAVARPCDEQSGFLGEACAGDESLRREIEKLVANDRTPNGSLERVASGVAAEWLRESGCRDLIGQSLGRYEVLALLGSGGMGEVYLARDKSLDRKVSLKLLPQRFTKDAERLRRFEQEARAVSALNHPNIITIYEIGGWNDAHFIAMEYIEGETLRDHMQKRPPLSELLEIGLQTAGALSAAHAAGIIHRDIKPANIMLRRDGYIKVLDFGLAKLTEEKPASKSHDAGTNTMLLTQPGLVLGTAHYMSPEQARGQKVDARSDIWSLGVVIYEMVGGIPPFRGETPSDCIASILKTEPPPLSSLSPDVPAKLQSIVEKALRKKRDERYQTITEMLADLRNLKSELEAEGSSPDSKALAKLIVGKLQGHKRAALLTLAAAILAAAALAYSVYFVAPAQSPNEKSIAVLPFADFSQARDQGYFCDGIQDEILTRVSKIADLKVISRTSTQRYKSAPANLPEIAKQLGVAHILEGTVQKSVDRIRVNVQLIKAQDDSHLWSETYDRKIEDIFAVESEIAERIATSLEARLTGGETKALQFKPTKNLAAYDAYLRALASERRTEVSLNRIQNVQRLYREAVTFDPKFALAWARLGIAEGKSYRNVLDPQHRAAAQQAIETALELQPDLGEAYLAQGYYYLYGFNNFSAARAAFEEARRMLPNNAEVLQAISLVDRRQGKFKEALALQDRAIQLDPRNPELLFRHASTYLELGQYPQARVVLDSALNLIPTDAEIVGAKAASYQAEGNLEASGKLLKPLPLESTKDFIFTTQIRQFLLERRYDETITALMTAVRNSALLSSQNIATYYALLGLAQERSGDFQGAHASYTEGRDKVEALRKTQHDSYTLAINVALMHAGLGDKDNALGEIKHAVDRWPHNVLLAAAADEAAAAINARFGEMDSSLRVLTRLLEVPYFYPGRNTPISRALLRLDPIWDPLRNDPRFQELIEKPKR